MPVPKPTAFKMFVLRKKKIKLGLEKKIDQGFSWVPSVLVIETSEFVGFARMVLSPLSSV